MKGLRKLSRGDYMGSSKKSHWRQSITIVTRRIVRGRKKRLALGRFRANFSKMI